MEFDRLIEQYQQSVNEFASGNSKPVISLLSRKDDVSLAGGFGGFMQGYHQVSKAIEYASSQFKEGEVTFENLAKVMTQDFAYVVEVESYKSRLGGSEEFSFDVLRVTSIFRREDGTWRLVHRHGDPTSAMNALIQLVSKSVVSIRKAV